jgi:hypothetical protein
MTALPVTWMSGTLPWKQGVSPYDGACTLAIPRVYF